jgi:hypothetical protein
MRPIVLSTGGPAISQAYPANKENKTNKQTLTTYKNEHRTQEVNYQRKRGEQKQLHKPHAPCYFEDLHPAWYADATPCAAASPTSTVRLPAGSQK